MIFGKAPAAMVFGKCTKKPNKLRENSSSARRPRIAKQIKIL